MIATMGAVLALEQIGCGADGNGEFGSASDALLTAATKNFTISGTYKNVTETSVAYQPGCNNNKGGWAVGFNKRSTSTTTFAGHSTSDPAGNVWTASAIPNGLAWGNPGPSPFDAVPFTGWRSDPSLAPVHNPKLNPSAPNSRILYSMVASNGNDAIVAYSDDCFGKTQGTSYLNTKASGGSVDNPVIATNRVKPFRSFATWTAGDTAASIRGYLNSFEFSKTGVFSKGSEVTIPRLAGKIVNHPTLAVGHYNACDGTSHEAVYVAYSTSLAGRCPGDGKPNIMSDQAWYGAVYDADLNWWVGGPWLIASDPTWPNCVGNDFMIDNDGRPRIAASNNGEAFWVAVPQSSKTGTRIHTYSTSVVCVNGGVGTPKFEESVTCNPDGKTGGCFTPGIGGTGGGGNAGKVMDEFAPAIAFSEAPPGPTNGPRLVVTFMGTRNDLANRFVGTYMMHSENFAALTEPLVISRVPAPLTAAVLFDHTVKGWDWSDYNGIGSDGAGRFLTTWGGDSRDFATNNYSGIGSTIIQ